MLIFDFLSPKRTELAATVPSALAIMGVVLPLTGVRKQAANDPYTAPEAIHRRLQDNNKIHIQCRENTATSTLLLIKLRTHDHTIQDTVVIQYRLLVRSSVIQHYNNYVHINHISGNAHDSICTVTEQSALINSITMSLYIIITSYCIAICLALVQVRTYV